MEAIEINPLWKELEELEKSIIKNKTVVDVDINIYQQWLKKLWFVFSGSVIEDKIPDYELPD